MVFISLTITNVINHTIFSSTQNLVAFWTLATRLLFRLTKTAGTMMLHQTIAPSTQDFTTFVALITNIRPLVSERSLAIADVLHQTVVLST